MIITIGRGTVTVFEKSFDDATVADREATFRQCADYCLLEGILTPEEHSQMLASRPHLGGAP